MIKTIEWRNDKVIMLDQRKLPTEEVYETYSDYLRVAVAIETMVIRGAPAIGVAAAFGVALGALGLAEKSPQENVKKLSAICERLAQTRPTAVNLFWAINRMKKVIDSHQNSRVVDLQNALREEAIKIYEEDIATCRALSKQGATLFKDGMTILTHCNAGALATAGYGTALGCIYAAAEEGKNLKVYADETRPVFQGARLTTWELKKHGIPVTVIADNMAGLLMQEGKINAVIVGADRIAANGDVVNKIGTYPLAVMAKEHHIPFYVAAPMSTVDLQCATAKEIPIEVRKEREITHVGDVQITPEDIGIFNPAFDRTPGKLITAIITENGIIRGPFQSPFIAVL